MERAKTKKINKNQPSYIIKKKLKNKVNTMLAQKKRQEEARKAFETFLKKEFSASFAEPNYMARSRGSSVSKYFTRRLRR